MRSSFGRFEYYWKTAAAYSLISLTGMLVIPILLFEMLGQRLVIDRGNFFEPDDDDDFEAWVGAPIRRLFQRLV